MDKSKSTIKLYHLCLATLLSIILHGTGDDVLFPIPYANGVSYDSIVTAGQQVNINASRISTPVGSSIDFTWIQIGGNSLLGDNKTLKGPVLSFRVPVSEDPQVLRFELVASKGQATKTTDVNVLVPGDQPPKAEAGNHVIVRSHDICGGNIESPQATLDGSNSTDTEGGLLKYNWTQIGGPPVTIFNPNKVVSLVQSFFSVDLCELPQPTYFEFRLDVTDSIGQTAFDTVTIFVTEIGMTAQDEICDNFVDDDGDGFIDKDDPEGCSPLLLEENLTAADNTT